MGSGRPDFGDGATPGKIFVGGLAQGTTLDTFVKYFGNYGEITDSVIMKDRHTGRLRGFGFITYADPSVVDTVIAETHIINGKQVEIKRTIPKVAAESKDFKTKRIFVGGIPTSMTEDEFKNFFSKYGKVVEHEIIQDYMTKKSQGFGFIVFDNEQVVDNILVDGNMIDMLGTQVEIKKAEPKKSSNPTLAPAYCSDSRGRAFGDSFGGFGNSYSSFGSGSFDPPPFRSMGSSLGGRFGDYGGYGDTSEFGGPYGDFASSEYVYRGDGPLGYSSRFGSYGGGYDGGLGAYGRGGGYGSYSGAGSGPGAGYGYSYGGGGLYGSRAGYSGGSRYHPYGRFLLVGAYKLNTDGRVKGGSASGGGIIRNHDGHCIRAFSAFYGDCKILEAELRAILDGILLARRLGITSIWIEADSLPAINSIIKMRGPLFIQEILKQIRDILHLDRGTIAHIYRENNRVADSLASVGWEQKVYREYGMKDLPDNIRALVHIDRLELPCFTDKV